MILSRRRLAALGLALPSLARAQDRATLRIGALAPRGIGTVDPHFATAHVDRMLASWTHSGLVRFRPGSASPAALEPDLAESWTSSADRRVWTFRLRGDAAIHGGLGVIDADDVVFSVRKAATPGTSGYAGDYAGMAAVEALDPRTVRITMRESTPALLGLVANYAGGFVVPRAAAAGSGLGSGPFRLAGGVAGQSMRLAAHDGYFRGSPRLGGIEYRFVSALATSDLAFRAGELDVAEGQQDQSWIARTRGVPGAVVDVIGPAEISWLHLNVMAPPLDDARVRRAVMLAVNRPELVRWRGADLAREARTVVPEGTLGFAPDVSLPGPDPEGARRLLAAAGHPDGVVLRTIHTGNAGMLGAIQVVQAQLRRAGITLEVQVVEHLTYHQMIRQDLSPVVHYAAARFPVADVMLTQFFHGRSTVGGPGGVANFSHCTAADAVLDAARHEPDLERQLGLWARAQGAILDAGCAVPLIETRSVWARRAGVEYGFRFEAAMATGPLLTEEAAVA